MIFYILFVKINLEKFLFIFLLKYSNFHPPTLQHFALNNLESTLLENALTRARFKFSDFQEEGFKRFLQF